jgi:hypothetical protein
MVCNDRKIGQIPSTTPRVPRGTPVNKPLMRPTQRNRSGVGFLPQTFVKGTSWFLSRNCHARIVQTP